MQRLITLKEFPTLAASDNTYVQYIMNGDANGLEDWIKHHLYRDLGDKPLRQLRLIASKLCIVRYTLLTRAELLSEIINHDDSRFNICGNGVPHCKNETTSEKI